MNPEPIDTDEVADIMAAERDRHELTTTLRPRTQGRVDNEARCACGEQLDWLQRKAQHDRHVLVEMAAVVVDYLY